MNFEATAGSRFARWWVGAITRTAERRAALDRRAEIASDVHEQLVDAWRRDSLPRGSRSVAARVIRGMPSDLAWRAGLELRPSRFLWHLRNPSTAITSLFVLMFPLNMAADSAGTRSQQLVDYRVPLWTVTDIAGCGILLFALLALVTRVWQRWTAGVEPFRPQSRLERLRRCVTAALGVAWAGSAVFRFGPFSVVGGAFWAAFGAALLLYVAILAASGFVKLLTLGRYLPKVAA